MSHGDPDFLLTLPGVRKRTIIIKAVLETIHWLSVESYLLTMLKECSLLAGPTVKDNRIADQNLKSTKK